MNKTYKPNCL